MPLTQALPNTKLSPSISFRDPTSNHVDHVVRPERNSQRGWKCHLSSPLPVTCDGILRCAMPMAPRQLPSQPPPTRQSQRPDRTHDWMKPWGKVRAPQVRIQLINHQIESNDDVLRSYYFLIER